MWEGLLRITYWRVDSPPPLLPPEQRERERERERELESSGGNLSRSLFPIQSSEERLESGGWGTELGKVLLIGDTGERQLEGSDICTCVGGIGGHLLSAPIVGGGGTRT